MALKECNILLGGEAGQGLVTVGSLLSKAFVRQGYHIVVTQSYESRIRGGHNTFAIRVSTEEISAPSESPHLLVALNKETISIHKNGLAKNALIVGDASYNMDDSGCVAIPYKELSSGKSANVVALGVVAKILGLDKNAVAEAVEAQFGKKDPKIAEENELALKKAYDWAEAQKIKFDALEPPAKKEKRLILNGNDAIALGAMSAGVKFYSFYPMTPATSVGLTLAANAKKLGLIVEQAEDEIAAINMAIGAAYAGAPSMVGTSGGGFALMVEGVSLAAMIETPIVIVVGQRPAPATGLPTRTEQGDLEFVLHSGHGEFARAIFAPGSVEECFFLTRRAFELANKYQTPVFILTDQFLADSDRAISPFDIEKLEPIRCSDDISKATLPYKRFELTADGVSPRLFPGASENLVVVDSDEHTEDGHLTEDLAVRKLMVEKRLKKMDGLIKETTSPEYAGDQKPKTLFVTWGSSKGAVSDAVLRLSAQDGSAAMLHFSQVWPLNASQFTKYFDAAQNVVCVEGNATAQFARLIRRETGIEIQKRILRYDGLPITPEYILRNL